MNKIPVVGITAEYNPYHNGHLYQMNRAKLLTGAEYCVVILSGHFVQRGEPAVFDPWERAGEALLNGADAVFEMPAPFSTAAAPDFASYGISLMDALGLPFVSCGTENASEEEITGLAEILNEESPRFKEALQINLRNGLSFPEARSNAVAADLAAAGAEESFIIRTQEILSSPNNILALEYARAIDKLRSPLRLITVDRRGSAYHAENLEKTSFPSAEAIRKHLLSGGKADDLIGLVPEASFQSLAARAPMASDMFTGPVLRKIMDLLYSGTPLTDYADVSRELADRIENEIRMQPNWDALINSIKTRQYTYTRVSRALMHIFLGITTKSAALCKTGRTAPYARLLGFRRSSSELLGILKEQSAVPLISKAADASAIIGEDAAALSLFLSEIHAGDLWNSVYYDYTGQALPNGYERQIVIV